MTRVAVTGGIGSGKSFVCGLIGKRGIPIYNCDDAAKRLICSSDKIKEALRTAVGNVVLLEDGKINKAAMTSFLLKSRENALKINSIVHPAVAHDFMESGMNWMECAILYSSGFYKLVDKTICVTAPMDVRIRRIMARDNISYRKACDWIENQMPQDEIEALSDYKIVNDGKKDLDAHIEYILKDIGQ